jgi:uracil-DNA glycosylase
MSGKWIIRPGRRVTPVMARTAKIPAGDSAADSPIRTLTALAEAEAECRRCPLYKGATQAVPGQGRTGARLMLVGEQPGDKEDLAGKPFVGPAGAILDRALVDADVDRKAVFVTNAVKHFKFEQRGKRRLHKRPNAYEIERCRWWLDHERMIVRPAVIVALGATAARSLFGRSVTIGKLRGEAQSLADRTPAFVTIHPSYLLRIKDDDDKAREYRQFVADLRHAARWLARRAA